MSEKLYRLAEDAIAGKYEAVRKRTRGELRRSTEPLPFALTGLALLSHGRPEVRSRSELTLDQKQLISTLFRAASAAVARQMLTVHPALGDEVLEHSWFRDKLSVGPLKRLPRKDQATKLLRVLLSDSHQFIEYRKRGLFDWDNGDAQAALAIVYGWGARFLNQRGVLQRASSIHRQAREILAIAREAHPENPVFEPLEHRFRLAWHSLTPEESTRARNALRRFSARRVRGDRDRALQLLAVTREAEPQGKARATRLKKKSRRRSKGRSR